MAPLAVETGGAITRHGPAAETTVRRDTGVGAPGRTRHTSRGTTERHGHNEAGGRGPTEPSGRHATERRRHETHTPRNGAGHGKRQRRAVRWAAAAGESRSRTMTTKREPIAAALRRVSGPKPTPLAATIGATAAVAPAEQRPPETGSRRRNEGRQGLVIYVSPGTHPQLKLMAVRNGTTRQALCQDAIERLTESGSRYGTRTQARNPGHVTARVPRRSSARITARAASPETANDGDTPSPA